MEYLQKLSTLSTTKRYSSGSFIITENEGPPYSMYIILAGSVKVLKNHGDYNETVMATLQAGDFFGEMSLYLGQPRAATVLTQEETTVLEIDETNAKIILREYPELTENVMRSLCMRIADLNHRLAIKFNKFV